MGKKDRKTTHAAHIKRRTEGTSNELSFSVLDAAKNNAASEVGELKKPLTFFKRIPAISFGLSRRKPQGTPTKEEFLPISERGLPLSTASSLSEAGIPLLSSKPLSAQGGELSRAGDNSNLQPAEEVLRRKIARRQRRRTMTLLVMGAVMILFVAAGVFAFTVFNTNESHLEYLEQASHKVATTDDAITNLNYFVESSKPLSSVDLQALATSLDETTESLNEAGRLVERSRSGISLPEDKKALEQIQVAIDSRIIMITNGKKLLQARYEKEQGVQTMQQAWADVLHADSLAKEAAVVVMNTTNENVVSSQKKTEQSLDLFQASLETVNEIATYSINADLTTIKNYLQKRIDSVAYALASDEALLGLNKQEAQAQNEAYNTADSEAVVLARQLPSDPAQPILDAYIRTTDSLRVAYMQARGQANSSDSFLRDYFGT